MLKRTRCCFKYFALFIILILIFIIPGCNIGIFNYLPGFEIDTLFIVNSHYNYEIGDTLNLVCEATHPENDSLAYQWQCNSGTIIPNGNSAKFVFSEYTIFDISCKVIDSQNKWVKEVVTLDKSNKILIQGVLKANHSQSDSLLGDIPFGFEGIYYLWESAIKTSQNGTFSFTLEKPLTNLTFQTVGYYVNSSEFILEKNIPVSDFKETDVRGNKYGLDIILDIPSTNNFHEYIPLAIGNSWTFRSSYGRYDLFRSEITAGTEIWEISDMSETGDTLILDVSFDGIEYITPYSGSEGDTTWGEEHHLRRQFKLYKRNQFIFYDKTLFSQGTHYMLPVAENIFRNGLQYKYEDMVNSLEYERPILTNPESQNPQLEMHYSIYKMKPDIGPIYIRLDHYEDYGSSLLLQSFKPSE